ncbi:MAG TPA: hypothetical protein VK611_14205 [Acidimicrobiales bacterium]|nr:hypothetical protein [Acidimicrobiales bacterium]
MKTDVVIGAASGMGAAIAGRLGGEGRRLLLADLDVAGAERVAAGLGPGVEVLGFDLRSARGRSASCWRRWPPTWRR